MEDEIIPKKVLNGKCHNKRPVGKPRNRWEGIIQRDTSQILGIRAEHREWRRLLIETRPRGGSSATEQWKDGLDAMLCHCASGSQHFERTHAATQYHISKHLNCMQHRQNLVPCNKLRGIILSMTQQFQKPFLRMIRTPIRHIKNLFHLGLGAAHSFNFTTALHHLQLQPLDRFLSST
jgi:hypothetical protein